MSHLKVQISLHISVHPQTLAQLAAATEAVGALVVDLGAEGITAVVKTDPQESTDV